jgi:hypothetical protein
MRAAQRIKQAAVSAQDLLGAPLKDSKLCHTFGMLQMRLLRGMISAVHAAHPKCLISSRI